MTTLMKNVTCSFSKIKTDELQWKNHLVSTSDLKICKNIRQRIAIKFIELISNASFEEVKLNNLENEKTHDLWRIYFSTKLSKEKLNTESNDPFDNSALEVNLSSDFWDFIQNVAPDIGEEYFNTRDKITICKVCSVEINKSLLYDHVTSKEHRGFENFFMKYMTYCELCNKEKKDEWGEEIISEKHLKLERSKFCKLRNTK